MRAARLTFTGWCFSFLVLTGCATTSTVVVKTEAAEHPKDKAIEPSTAVVEPPRETSLTCGEGKLMRLRFYDAGQALAVLVELPNGKLLLVDSGDSPTHPGCGPSCKAWHERVLAKLKADVGTKEIALLWVTHPHADHAGGAAAVFEAHTVHVYADNGSLRKNKTVDAMLIKAKERQVKVVLTEETTATVALGLEGEPSLTVKGILPSPYPSASKCDSDPNDCSAMLRIDYCNSSVLFTGDAEKGEEKNVAVSKVDLLQVGHHGSDTSSSDSFLQKVRPQWAVVSAGQIGEGTNARICHPRAKTITALSAIMGDTAGTPVEAYDGPSCSSASPRAEWKMTPASANLFVTPRDGDVVLVTTGDGKFAREQPQ